MINPTASANMYLSFANICDNSTEASNDFTKTGVFLHPGLLRIFTTCLIVSASTFAGVMSIFVLMSADGSSTFR